MRIVLPLTLIAATVFLSAGLQQLDSNLESPARVEASSIDKVDPDLSKLSKYKNWTLVNQEPFLMDARTAALCAAVQQQNPHSNKYISVYVNGEGRESMLTRLEPSFPVGSMIIKEKLRSKDSTTPELLTAMIKREKGYYPEGGDWEYLLLDGAASKIIQRGKLDQCNSCHTMYKNRDFVTRTYLPADVIKGLK